MENKLFSSTSKQGKYYSNINLMSCLPDDLFQNHDKWLDRQIDRDRLDGQTRQMDDSLVVGPLSGNSLCFDSVSVL